MLRRLHIHNFCCLQNFEIKPGDNSSILLIGKNGTGKSTIAKALSVLQLIGSGMSRVGELLTKEDFTLNRIKEHMTFEIEVLLEKKIFTYSLTLDMPENFRELRVYEEKFSVDGKPVYTRTGKDSLVRYYAKQSEFGLDWHTVALPLIIETQEEGPLHILRNWLSRMHILAPIPATMEGESYESYMETLTPVPSCENFADYLTALLGNYPSAYPSLITYLAELMPDMKRFVNKPVATDARMIEIEFDHADTVFNVKFDRLSDGEKCIFLGAAVLATLEAQPNLFVFWDEPDNYLALSEVEHFIRTLRQNFRNGSQIWVTSHNEETMNCFSHENTILLHRKSHINPVEVRPVHEIILGNESISHKMRLNEFN